MGKVQSLEYGRASHRKRTLWLTAFVVTTLVAIPCSYYHAFIRSYFAERYAAYLFAREFDRVERALIADGDLWTATSSHVSPDPYLKSLLAISPAGVSQYLAKGQNEIVFVRRGITNGIHWLAFACINETGLEVFTFNRDDRNGAGYDRLYETRQFWGYGVYRTGSLKIDVLDVKARGDSITTVVNFDGGRNVIDWTLSPSNGAAASSRIAFAAPVPTPTATPRTGWVTGDQFWPNTGDVELIEGPSAPREIPGEGNVLALAFTANGRIALATTKEISLLDPASSDKTVSLLPHVLPDPKGAAFSPDGYTCFIANFSDPALPVDTVSGRVRELSCAGIPKASFLDNRTLMVLDNVKFRKIDCATGHIDELNMPGPYAGEAATGGTLTACTSATSGDVSIIGADGVERCRFKSIQGLHQISLSPDGHWLALKGQSGISLFDVQSRSRIWEHDGDFDLHTSASRIKWSSDGLRGAAAGSNFVYVWSLKSPRWVARFAQNSNGYFPDVAISADGRRMAAIGEGPNTVALWPDLDAVGPRAK